MTKPHVGRAPSPDRLQAASAAVFLLALFAAAAGPALGQQQRAGDAADASSAPAVADAPLKAGARGELVGWLQRTLNARLDPSPELTVDEEFGTATLAAVQRFQQQQMIEATGAVGPETWRALGPLVTSDTPVPAPGEVNGRQLEQQEADPLDGPPWVTCKAWAIGRADTGELLWGHEAQQRHHFASTTKIMTAHVVLQLAAENPDVLDEQVVFSDEADNTPGSTAGIRAGERLPVRELLYGLMLPSGNDASVALAEHFGPRFEPPAAASEGNGDGAEQDEAAGPLQDFVAEMNRTAAALGMADTHYVNPHGLTSPDHQATARDLLRLAAAAIEDERFCEYVATRQRGCTVQGRGGYRRHVLWKNTNRLLPVAGYHGVKTGTTSAAGACLVSLGQRGDDRLLVVVLGSTSSDARYTDTRNLFRWAWRQRPKQSGE